MVAIRKLAGSAGPIVRLENLRPLRGYFVVLLAIFGAHEVLRPLIADSALWQPWFGIQHTFLFWNAFGAQLLRLLMTFATWVVLIATGLKRRDYFLVKGQQDASAEPVRWLGERQPQPWTGYGRTFLIVFSLVFLVLSALVNRPSLNDLLPVVPRPPVAVLFAGLTGSPLPTAWRPIPGWGSWWRPEALQPTRLTRCWTNCGSS